MTFVVKPTWGLLQCVRKVDLHLGYCRVQVKCDGTWWRTWGGVRKVAVHL